MMRRVLLSLSVLLVSQCAQAQAVDADADAKAAFIKVDPAAQQASGIEVQKLAAVVFTPSRAAYGVVLDPGPLIALRSQIVSAQVARRYAAQSLSRAQLLYRTSHNIAMAALQGAEAQYATANANELALTAKARTDWGAALSTLLVRGGQFIQALSDGKASLIEAAVTGRYLDPPTSASGRVSGGARITLRLIGVASHVPSGLVGQGFYYAGPADLSSGLPLSLMLPEGSAQAGVAVPPKAILYLQGHKSVFREVAPSRFTMVQISNVLPMRQPGDASRYFVGKGLHSGDQVVVEGAGVLLSAAHAAPAPADTD
ncbi:efflux RND transporter periplasmic adaptor subunit [Acidiphilium acidophilum]|uniref:RND efflux pump membrane fusion protein barrel-sandwich domain-containing protein n=1 Tax=Acidiphilium acidophilum TaxID=76588 RepID=A0AAW9DMX7_ACIAO|nr:hypothetical protein [Acidiphilium acidophilum]MDX5929397.1 hypothetical protein [Acidiphilium acidophilum]